jgi:hypothetical protein
MKFIKKSGARESVVRCALGGARRASVFFVPVVENTLPSNADADTSSVIRVDMHLTHTPKTDNSHDLDMSVWRSKSDVFFYISKHRGERATPCRVVQRSFLRWGQALCGIGLFISLYWLSFFSLVNQVISITGVIYSEMNSNRNQAFFFFKKKKEIESRWRGT